MEFKWDIHVPQISRIYTDFFFAACAAEDKRGT